MKQLLKNYGLIVLIFQSFNFSIFQFSFSQNQLDAFQYNYQAGCNRLTSIDDAIDAANSTIDIDDQAEGNYEYNAIGQLTQDEAEGIESIEWNVCGKVDLVTKIDGSTILFRYDAMGNRITKTLITYNSQLTTFYLRDAIGNLIARYEQENSASINLKEFPLYGGSQLGTLETEIDPNAIVSNDSTFARTLATKNYQLKDHLGNIRVVVSDIKNNARNAANNPANFSADITMTSDYYSYGMQMPGRSYQSNNYKYGYQGKEKDNELNGESNSYDFGARLYDSRVGRWLSTDPLAIKRISLSPYNSMGNDPINRIDANGMIDDGASGDLWAEQNSGQSRDATNADIKAISKENLAAVNQAVEFLAPDEYDMAVAAGAIVEPTFVGEFGFVTIYATRRTVKLLHPLPHWVGELTEVTVKQIDEAIGLVKIRRAGMEEWTSFDSFKKMTGLDPRIFLANHSFKIERTVTGTDGSSIIKYINPYLGKKDAIIFNISGSQIKFDLDDVTDIEGLPYSEQISIQTQLLEDCISRLKSNGQEIHYISFRSSSTSKFVNELFANKPLEEAFKDTDLAKKLKAMGYDTIEDAELDNNGAYFTVIIPGH